MVDNCYGEFVRKCEPTSLGVDLMAGSLIKNPGGGIAPTGGYIVGKKKLVEMCSYRLTTPGLGKDVAMIHFKDFLRHDADGQLKACGAGQGEMEDYSTILRFAKQEKPFVFATLENTTPENAVACREFLQKQYDNC